MPRKDPCQSKACAIQDCLAANNYQESACQDVIRRMIECCNLWKEESFNCQGFTTKLLSPDESKKK